MFKYTNVVMLNKNDNLCYIANYLVRENVTVHQLLCKTVIGTFVQLLDENFSEEAQRFIGNQRWLLAVPAKYIEDFKTLIKLAKVDIDVIDIDIIAGVASAFTMLESAEF